MEHIIKTDLGNGYFRLTAEKDFALFAKNLNRIVSKAVIKDNFNNFEARPIQ